MNLTQFIESNANKFLTRPAIGFKKDDEWKSLSWMDFRRTIYKTANALKNYGIGPGDRVGIYSDNSAEWVVFDLAALAIGAVTVPLYSTANEEQIRYILKDAQVRILLTGNQEQYERSYVLLEEGHIELLIAAKKRTWIKKQNTFYLEDFIMEASDSLEIEPRDSEDLATLIYTSGTTGVPKGVMLTHGNFTNNINSHFDFFKFKNFTSEHSLAFLPLTHVFERSWTYLCLTGGAKVTFLENTTQIASALKEVKPTMMCAVPRFFQKIYIGVNQKMEESSDLKKKLFHWALSLGKQKSELRRDGKNVPLGLQLKYALADRLVFSKIKNQMGGNLWFMPCGGASISRDVSDFFDHIGLHLTVGYGLTETTATVTAMPLEGYKPGSCGILLGGTEINLGEDNEILVKGTGVMKGYYNREEETKAVLSEDGWLRTGDQGELRDGHLFITDRLKDLMKTSNGKYVAPQPIENLLSDQPLIASVVLVAENRPFVSALLVPNFEVLKPLAEEKGLLGLTEQELCEHPEIKKLMDETVNLAQKNLQGFEKVKKMYLLPQEFAIESGEMTPTLKIRRKVVLERYADAVESMYHN